MEDDDLLAAAARGDGDAFAAFYRRHGDLVLGYLRKRVADPEQAFDLAAETVAADLATVRGYRPGPVPGWAGGSAALCTSCSRACGAGGWRRARGGGRTTSRS